MSADCPAVYGLSVPDGDARGSAYTLLAQAVSLHWGLHILPQIDRGPHGKPFFPQYPQLHFNLSHSRSTVLCALDTAPVGIDIQYARPSRSGFLDRICAPEERIWLRERGDSPAAFAQLWTLKESRCKWSGRGITFPVLDIRVPLPEKEGCPLVWENLCFSLVSGGDWQAALCASRFWDGTIHWLNL